MISDKFTIHINKRKFKVPYKVMICHATNKFKTLQPDDVYSKFINSFILRYADRHAYVTNLASYFKQNTEEKLAYLKKSVTSCSPFTNKSILVIAWATYCMSKGTNITSYNDLLIKYIDYNEHNFSKEYSSINPKIEFYKALLLKFDPTKNHPVYINNEITEQDITDVLVKLNYNISAKDILEDINHHSILTRYDDHFIWGSSKIKNWLLDLDYADYSLLCTTKLLSKLNI
jgi:hypothetical protein